jgi:Fe-S cluster assembly iron-binding protein IscA
MIEISDEASYKIKEILDKNPGKRLRIEVEGDGCAGPYLRLILDEAGTNELTTRVNDIVFLISDQVERYAEVTTIKIYVNHIDKSYG